jgi:putative SOS response-associated peptidase YedK
VCNRYRLTHSKQYLAERFQAAGDEIEERPRYNIAPTQPVLTVRREHGKIDDAESASRVTVETPTQAKLF